MEGNCQACSLSFAKMDEGSVAAGVCSACGAQLVIGEVSTDHPVTGSVAMAFPEGSNVGVSLSEKPSARTPLPSRSGDSAPTPPPAPEDAAGQPPAPPADGAPNPDDFAPLPTSVQPAPQIPPPPENQSDPEDGIDVDLGDETQGEPESGSNEPPLDMPTEPPLAAMDSVSVPADAPHLAAAAGSDPTEKEDSEPSTPQQPDEEADAPPPHMAAAFPASNEVPPPDEPASPTDFPAAAPPPESSDDASADTQEKPKIDDPEPSETQEETGVDDSGAPETQEAPQIDDSEGDVPAAAAPAGAEEDEGNGPDDDAVPEHLRLPSIDFTIPDFSDRPSGASVSSQSESDRPASFPASENPSTSGGASTDLPAHLQLPSFPELEVPGQSSEPASPPAEEPVAAPPRLPPMPAQPSAAVAAEPASTQPASAPDGMFELSLPEFATEEPKRNPTLVNVDVSSLQQSKPFTRWIVPGVVLLVIGGGVVGGLSARDQIVGWFSPDAEVEAVLSTEGKAKQAYLEGRAALNAKKSKEALARFQAAVGFGMSEAHRDLGIVYATLKNSENAVKHYRLYLESNPNASDRASVQKIVDDYDSKKAKKDGGKSPSSTKSAKPKRKKRRRR